jgi:hypothetical protein
MPELIYILIMLISGLAVAPAIASAKTDLRDDEEF